MRRGHVVVSAANGAGALERAAWDKPDAVILDVRLPTLEGGRVVEILRANPLTKETPVVLISAADRRWLQGRMPLDALTRFVEKPLDFDALDETIAALLPAPQA